MWLRILSPGATDSCLSGRGRRPAFRPLIATNSKERGHAQALPSRPQGRQARGGAGYPLLPILPNLSSQGRRPLPQNPKSPAIGPVIPGSSLGAHQGCSPA
jgi:hypothetical protein